MPLVAMPMAVWGFLNRSVPASGSGLTLTMRGAVALGLFQGGEHPGVVGAGVLAGDDDEVGVVEVVEQHAALADAEGFGEGGAGRLVAHVGAVGQVVGAEVAGEELEEEGGFVAGAARGVEDGLVGGVEGAQFVGDDLEGAFPGHGFVVLGAFGEVHRLGDAALLAEPVAAAAGEVGDGVLGEEVGGDAAQGGFFGDGFGAVLAEFEVAPFAFFRPGAAGAVEAVLLVDLEQGQGGPSGAHLGTGDPHGVPYGGQSGGGVLGWADVRRVLDGVSYGGLLRHASILPLIRGGGPVGPG